MLWSLFLPMDWKVIWKLKIVSICHGHPPRKANFPSSSPVFLFCKGAQLVTYFLSQSLKRSHTRFKTGSIYLLREFQLLRTEIGCLKSSASVPRRLLISQRKEFCSAAQTFLCIFLRRSLTMALAVASSEKELHCVAIPFCLHGWLVFPKGWESGYMCFLFTQIIF